MSVPKEKRGDQRTAQMGALHQAIGEFAVTFENISHQQFRCIAVLLKCAGLRDERATRILFANYTSEPMRAM